MHLSIPPTINYLTGNIDADNVISKQTTLGSLKGVFADEAQRAKSAQDRVIYYVEMLPAQHEEGELNFGVSHIEPGVVGDEFHMTRGHIHQRKEQAEFYFGSQGEGLLLMQTEQGEVLIEKVCPGSVHHIPGFVAHRLINTGNSRLSALAVWPAIAGHNYDFLTDVGFKVRVLTSSTGYKIASTDDC
ncbi:glucose-6-phosphate isomerase [Vibrio sp. 10N.286.49.C2]|uniref:glucose-6-phosphate isomerase family protein n=1 Tax=unclassified Vibrio TaxID=2614977 RepID=UPI000C85C252|nr:MULTISPECIES: glucose-6-phosphate isomerase family protein [unclassified Vibrio]PMH38826.1 glucose-6-phosphate isomerase [Vibrio sp. 10N.286.49.C2]PMH55302.1 glucose-6-phosphate isomerase [Vibrio sp. 10N.286.49.B1]PMH83803.1 glucose-6-phosphate isomerase [Vibrio sp. 10N.286.48.B7]